MSYPRHSCWKQYKTLFCSSKKKPAVQNIDIYRFNNEERKDLAPQTQPMHMPLSKAGLIVNTYIYGSEKPSYLLLVRSVRGSKWDTAYIHVQIRDCLNEESREQIQGCL